ncbi:thiamine phosphate synthase [Pelagibius sp.]|uniref:thiamine phosphate synthase n=1 Tax=Pelagibius sp. TaxID=1931238 RepID=UPI002626D76C|nr:thiamine phosphate synthase [Pelagibius sp.]
MTPPLDDPAAAGDALAGALDGLLTGLGDPLEYGLSVLLLRDGALDDDAHLERATPLLVRAQAAGVAVLFENRVGLVEPSGGDGVHLSLGEKPGAVKALRRQLGEGVILGAACGASRHAAMLAGEEGADYVAFGALDGSEATDPDLVDWWARSMTPPLVVCGAGDPAAVRSYAEAGADFIALNADMWLHVDNPLAAFTGLAKAAGHNL